MRKLFVLGLFLAASPCWAGLTVVQAASNEVVTGSTSTTLTVTISTTAGNLLVIFARQGSDNTSTATVSDSASQTWTQVSPGSPEQSETSLSAYAFYKPNSAAVTSVTITFSAAVKNRSATVYEVSGAATSSPLDSSVGNDIGGANTSITSASMTTSNANDILLFGATPNGASGGFTAGSPFSCQTNGCSNTREALEYEIVSSVQTNVTATMNWVNSVGGGAEGIFFALKASGAAPPPCTNFIALLGAGCK